MATWRWLFGMVWDRALFVDTVLPFGLRSAPKLFNAVADVVEWILRQAGVVNILHYLDDFLLVGAPGSGMCRVSSKVVGDLRRIGFACSAG